MSDRFKYQVKRSSVWCLILLLMSTLFPTTTIFASPGSAYSSAIAGGGSHTILLKNDGTVWTWGLNNAGQLGDGTMTDRSLPVQVSGLSGVIAIAGGAQHTIALKNDETVWDWGWNYYGQLGDGTFTNRSAPFQVPGISGVIAIAGGTQHTIALKNDGTVWAWGANGVGELGDGTTMGRTTPVQVSGLSGVVEIASVGFHTVALKNDGTVWAWGWNAYGQLGDGTTTDRLVPVQVSGLSGIVTIAGGAYHTIALKNDGMVWTWGYNANAQLGDGTTTNRLVPVQVSSLSGVVAITGGVNYTIALKNDGTVWTWGNNQYGQLGDGTLTDRSLPVQVLGLSGVVAIAGGSLHTIALKNDATVWTWGNNQYGQLGDGTTMDRSAPVQVRVIFYISTPIKALTFSSKTLSSVTLTWPTAAVATSITVEQSSDGGTTWSPSTTGTIAANASTTTATGLSPNTAYLFRLIVTGGFNAGTSNAVSVTTNAAPTPTPTPKPITAFAVSAKTSSSVTLTWPMAANATSIKLQKSLDGGLTWSTAIGSIPPSATTATATGLKPNTAYKFRLIVTGGGNAGTSNIASVTTSAIPVTTFANITKTSSSATFSWKAVTGATSLSIKQSTDGGLTWHPSTTGTIATGASTATVTGLTPNTAYKFRLIVTGGGNAGTSNIASVTTKP